MGSPVLPDLGTEILIPVCAIIGIGFSLFQWLLVSKVKLTPGSAASNNSGGAGKNGHGDYLIEEEEGLNDHNTVLKCAEIQNAISEGATSFLFTEYQYVGIFMVAFAILIFVFLGSVEGFSTKSQPCTYDPLKLCKPALATAGFSTIAFILGAVTSVVSGFLGMKIATYANARTTLEARKGVGKAFITAFRSGAVMGFLLAANGLLVLYIAINLFKLYYGDDWAAMLLRLGALTPLLRSSLFSPKPILLSPLITAKTFFSLSSFSTAPFQSSLVSHSFNPKPTTLFDSGKNAISVDPYYLSCCMADKDKPLRIAVLLSGGVDSSVALRLLHAAGHHCTAFYLKIWFQEDFNNFWSECPWEEDLKFAKGVCDQVGVPLEVVHLTDEYWSNVVSYIIEEYRCGRTPNPDVLCNTRIKFGAFMDAINNMEFDYVASGHYAHVIHPVSDQINKPSVLELSKDKLKDQTYFLSHLTQAQLKRLIFPLGCIPKEEVRNLASKFDLPNKDRKDSQGICFLGKIKFSEFVGRHIGESKGVILEAETGDFLGIHRGFWFYTIGQRQGLRLPGGPWYVVEKDVKNNVVFVSRNYFSLDKRRRSFRVGSLKWLSGSTPDMTGQLQCKVRHGPSFYDCSVKIELGGDSPEEVVAVHLCEDDQGLAAGQFTAFYQGRTCIGSGVILESWDDKGFPVCKKALELARLEDKSKLGKPVKIKVKPETSDQESVQKDGIEPDKGLAEPRVAVTG